MYFTIITALKKLFKNKILICKIKLFAIGELFLKKINLKYIEVIYTSSRGRTGTMLPSLDFESSASANSAMLAYDYDNIIMHILSIFSEVQSR